MRSDEVKTGPARAGARAMWKAIGLTDEAISRPLIGIANTWTEITPCNWHLRALAEQVKIGVREAGGTPLEFNTIVVTDGIAMGDVGDAGPRSSRGEAVGGLDRTRRARPTCFDGVVGHLRVRQGPSRERSWRWPGWDLPSLMLYGRAPSRRGTVPGARRSRLAGGVRGRWGAHARRQTSPTRNSGRSRDAALSRRGAPAGGPVHRQHHGRWRRPSSGSPPWVGK